MTATPGNKEPASTLYSTLPSYSTVACIGAGLSGIGLGAQLKRWYDFDDIQFFERHSELGGTWWINTYPGCACDVPSALYSFSFEQNPSWTKLMPSNEEIRAYTLGVAEKYHLPSKIRFNCDVERCDWLGEGSRWLLRIREKRTGELFLHECQILFSACGQLVEPRELDIPGVERFNGKIFHSARWDHSVNLEGKDVVVIGNGCTAAQIVPSIVPKVKSVTQIIRTKHWIFEAANLNYTPFMAWCFRNIPGAMALHRFIIFATAESSLPLFYMNKMGARARASKRRSVEKFMREKAPQKYHELLIPDFDVGCKRRIFNDGYLESLHALNLTLTDQKVLSIVPEGLETTDGIVKVDVIVLANGFKTNEFLDPLQVHGRNGLSLTQHWANFGGPSAYNCSVMSGFPNFFMLLGPNAATGHTSAMMASENMVNYALRILAPVLRGKAVSVEVKYNAEKQHVYHMQDELRKRVWSAGCNSWYIKDDNQWNSMSYPWSQAYFWYRSLFPHWNDWVVKPPTRSRTPKKGRVLLLVFLGLLLALIGRGQRDVYLRWAQDKLASLLKLW
ncbi:related to flavoprotein involved in K+ transport [Phialocephala subalpina]|uniref:Related to flavoprotein involved in K+ transport n=1 Tax=Phialocephala subalpina TaxID=576137 RepID=A0A1L7XST6_9HELO|nr:related to flavoprotein involved in K+ transport [Phialocephala subalpina]